MTVKLELEPVGVPRVTVASETANAVQGCNQVLVTLVAQDDIKAEDSSCSLKASTLEGLPAEVQAAAAYAVLSSAFKAKKGEASQLVQLQLPGSKAQSLLLLGLGPQQPTQALPAAAWGHSAHQAAGAALAAVAKKHHLKHVTILFPPADPPAAAQSFLSSFLSQLLYERTMLKSKKEPVHHLQSVEVVLPGAGNQGGDLVRAAVAYARGVYLTRYLVDLPANICTPTCLATAAAHIAQHASGNTMQLQVLEKEECEALGMGLFLGVDQGSDEPLKLIHLTYKGKDVQPGGKVLALVGKGITFDTGGYNLKVQGGVETMKCDMGGAAAVLGAARIIAELQPPGLEVHFITASCENMISGKATRPSDIHTSANGLTVEIDNTDAEGRLTLADALWYAQKKAGAQVVLDIATLTGACGIALGQDTAALFANADSLAAELTSASGAAGEKFWRMPLDPDLKKLNESHLADLKNHGGRFGGTITAALFLNEFIEPGVEWAHMDIAGPAWSTKEGGATGFGAATLATWLTQRGEAGQAAT